MWKSTCCPFAALPNFTSQSLKMKKQQFLIFLLVAAFSFLSCNNKEDTYTLKMRLAPGDKFKQSMDTDMEVAVNAMGQDVSTKMKMLCELSFEVTGDTGNLKKLSFTYDDFKMRMKMANVPEEVNMDSIMDKSTEGIKGQTITIMLNEKNEIVEVNGIENIIATSDMQARAQMEKMFSKDQLNSMMGMMFQMYPNKPVKVGETWENEIETSVADIKMKVKGKYTLKSVKDGVASVEMKGTYTGKGTLSQGGTSIDVDMDGNQEGIINIGLADGYLKDADYKMDVKAEMNTMGQKMPMTMKGRYLMKGK